MSLSGRELQFAVLAAVRVARRNPCPPLLSAWTLGRDLDRTPDGIHPQVVEPPHLDLLLGSRSAVVAAEAAAMQTARADIEIRQIFETTAFDAGVQWEWREPGEAATARIARHARYSDLLLLFRQASCDHGRAAAVNIPGVIMESGRPALVLPPEYRPPHLPFRRVVIGWNGSREASRAVHDALPFLRRADRVILAIAAEDSLFRAEDEPALDIGKHLQRHGVRVDVERLAAPGQDAGTQILSLAGSISADLIVAGCYGHVRLTEFLFGGVSRTLLGNSTIPLLLSY
jgi:nucleotide-binding universal stress UspA family protein